MHRILQQNWIEGKSCLAEEEHRQALLDILNLLSEQAEASGEAVTMPEEKQEEQLETLIDQETQEIAAIEILPKEADSMEAAELETKETEEKETEGKMEKEVSLQGADLEGTQEEVLYVGEEDCGKIPIWYYCPNGSLIKR